MINQPDPYAEIRDYIFLNKFVLTTGCLFSGISSVVALAAPHISEQNAVTYSNRLEDLICATTATMIVYAWNVYDIIKVKRSLRKN